MKVTHAARIILLQSSNLRLKSILIEYLNKDFISCQIYVNWHCPMNSVSKTTPNFGRLKLLLFSNEEQYGIKGFLMEESFAKQQVVFRKFCSRQQPVFLISMMGPPSTFVGPAPRTLITLDKKYSLYSFHRQPSYISQF